MNMVRERVIPEPHTSDSTMEYPEPGIRLNSSRSDTKMSQNTQPPVSPSPTFINSILQPNRIPILLPKASAPYGNELELAVFHIHDTYKQTPTQEQRVAISVPFLLQNTLGIRMNKAERPSRSVIPYGSQAAKFLPDIKINPACKLVRRAGSPFHHIPSGNEELVTPQQLIQAKYPPKQRRFRSGVNPQVANRPSLLALERDLNHWQDGLLDIRQATADLHKSNLQKEALRQPTLPSFDTFQQTCQPGSSLRGEMGNIHPKESGTEKGQIQLEEVQTNEEPGTENEKTLLSDEHKQNTMKEYLPSVEPTETEVVEKDVEKTDSPIPDQENESNIAEENKEESPVALSSQEPDSVESLQLGKDRESS